MSSKIKVIAITGIRSEYDLLYPLLKALHEDSDFDLGIIVTGAHLTPIHDFSVRQIEQDKFRIVEKIETLHYSDSIVGKVRSTGILLHDLGAVLDREKPDLLIVLGDREETVIGALAGSYMAIPVIHLAGGDNTYPIGGDVDEQVRHAATKLSHVHLTMAEEHSLRIKRLGEEAWRIHCVGSAGVDRLRTEDVMSREELAELLGKSVLNDYLVLIFHALSSEIDDAGESMRIIIEACLASGLEVFIGAPNSDPGYHNIQQMIQSYQENDRVHSYRNLPRREFSSLFRNAKCLVGNSSLALHEAPFIGLPAINVGERQKGRLAGSNVQFVSVNFEAIISAIQRAIGDENYRETIVSGKTPYGDGYMVERTMKILKELPSREILLSKKITY